MSEQLAPFALQRCHWYANEIGFVPVQLPGSECMTSPRSVVPEIVGGDVLLGAAAPAAVTLPVISPRPAMEAPAARTPSTAPSRKGRFFVEYDIPTSL